MGDESKRVAKEILNRYLVHFDREIQGCCLVIADEIQKAIGGEVVAGYIRYAGSNKRSHWWVEKDGVTIDPMGDWQFDGEPFFEREEVHRDRQQFENILMDGADQWRAPA